MYKILKIIKKCLSGWKPSDIFHDGNEKYFEYAKPISDFFGESHGYWHNDYTYTKLGQFFEDAPVILSLLKLFWYVPACFIWCVVNFFWMIVYLFLPRKRL